MGNRRHPFTQEATLVSSTRYSAWAAHSVTECEIGRVRRTRRHARYAMVPLPRPSMLAGWDAQSHQRRYPSQGKCADMASHGVTTCRRSPRDTACICPLRSEIVSPNALPSSVHSGSNPETQA